MRFVSIDIETTSIEPHRGQILSVGAVLSDLADDRSISQFYQTIQHERLVGDLSAILMNSDLLRQIESGYGNPVSIINAYYLFSDWLQQHGVEGRLVAAGKNVASFDLAWLRHHCRPWADRFHYRTLDPTIAYTLPTDTVPPDLGTCLSRAGLPARVTHNALSDAEAVARLIRYTFSTKETR